MKNVFAEVYRIFKKAPLHISLILLMDIAGAIIWAANPYIIGVCIDDLLRRKYCWLCIFIALQLLLIALRTADKILDTRIYSRIIEEESTTYYEKADLEMGVIVDITADQFGEPPVYVGLENNFYRQFDFGNAEDYHRLGTERLYELYQTIIMYM